ncbi:uncharacterized protein LOC123519620 [Portunus trituberculatus]|uniref:uncharacterized protein LOC123519620 n=1 Tax=Portunus trituberculatus TaxID=210409 RepID=UPI001E1D0DAF|nr:uncharacterized protein LOC123519620 [Portunus trituberculatus]
MARPQTEVYDVLDENSLVPVHSTAQSSGFDDTPAHGDDQQGTPWPPLLLPDTAASSSTFLSETDGISERLCRQGRHPKPVGVVKPMRSRLVALRPNQRPRPLVQAAGASTLQPASWGTSLSRAPGFDDTTSGHVSLPIRRNTALPPNNASPASTSSSNGGVAEGRRVEAARSAIFFRLNRRCNELGRRNEALEQKLAAYRRFFTDKDNLKSWMRRLDTEGDEVSQASPGEEEDARQMS